MKLMKRLESVGRAPSDREWSVVAGRSPEPADRWLIVVTTTGIVCKPGCAARTPARGHVRVVSGLAEGLAAGARPCLRCRPDRDVAGGAAGRRDEAGSEGDGAVPRLLRRLDAALASGDAVPGDRELAAEAGLSERRLRELFREQLGVTPRAWVAARRSGRLRTGLSEGRDVLDALLEAGYSSSSAAYEAADAELGMPPGRYRDGAPGESIAWTAVAIPDGRAVVAATPRGICAVRLGGDDRALEAELRAEFPRASLRRDDAAMAGYGRLVADLAVGRPHPEVASLPLDVQATAFRRRVWEELRRIPAGETRSYAQVAAAVGAPGAARAVGTACAENPVAVVVPCHRVVGSDGSLHGYAYGLDRKRQLLDAERDAARGGETDAVADAVAEAAAEVGKQVAVAAH